MNGNTRGPGVEASWDQSVGRMNGSAVSGVPERKRGMT